MRRTGVLRPPAADGARTFCVQKKGVKGRVHVVLGEFTLGALLHGGPTHLSKELERIFWPFNRFQQSQLKSCS